MALSGLLYCRWWLTGWSLCTPDGKITRKFDDPDGKVMSFVTTAFEFEDHLYLGTLNNNFIGKLKLNPTNS
ncbi:hypothetical protein OIU84_010739 [Salix udensis]|uniref:Strictosidine synthase conserved region domain-containing protein n=1 Tax=Salix udensis TaxID=889485 RepID=A0AAD6JLF8_9ROSI|nr:hypothetical protein OIU84_010739 [Salix udensis]